MDAIGPQFSARRLVEARRRANLTREQLAFALGVSVVSVANWEQGRVSPKSGRLFALADFLDVAVADLFEEVESV